MDIGPATYVPEDLMVPTGTLLDGASHLKYLVTESHQGLTLASFWSGDGVPIGSNTGAL